MPEPTRVQIEAAIVQREILRQQGKPIPHRINVIADYKPKEPRMSDNTPREMEIGYICSRGHFEFEGDPEGDYCGTKRVAGIYVRADEWLGLSQRQLQEYVSESLASHHRKMTEWRES
jgi:hypothetical protein